MNWPLFSLFKQWYHCIRAVSKFQGYKPQPVTYGTFWSWLSQFDRRDRDSVLNLLSGVQYLTEERTKQILVHLNRDLLRNIQVEGIHHENVIYVQIDDAGSSSPVMLNLLRNAAGLQRKGCKFVDGKNTKELHSLTDRLEEGVIIYVDDFVGTGDQFLQARDFSKQYVVGNFPEYIIAPCICEEGYSSIVSEGITPLAGIIHPRADRPLSTTCSSFQQTDRDRLCELSKDLANGDYYDGLGYKRCATMVVLYHNAPDTTPWLLRGAEQQMRLRGILPRFSDLPVEE